MALQVTMNGDADGGFLIVGDQGQLQISTDDGSAVAVSLRGAGPLAGAIAIVPPSINASGTPASATLNVAAASTARGDAVIEALVGGAVVATLRFTAIVRPLIQFEGRFQCRLATDPDGYNHSWGINSSFGMYAVQGPSAAAPYEPPLDRIIRFHNSVSLRPFCQPIGVFVRRVGGLLLGGQVELFEVGDNVIGESVQLGPACTFDARDGAFADPGFEPISDFEVTIGTAFAGATEPGLPRSPGAPPSSKAPYADGLFRMDNVSAMRPTDFGYPELTWTARADSVTNQKIADLAAQAAASPRDIAIRARRQQEHANNLPGIRFALRLVERYEGIIDKRVVITPGTSAVMRAFANQSSFSFRGEFFDFDTDCQTGTVWGTIGV